MDSEERDDATNFVWGFTGFSVVSAVIEDSWWGEEIKVVRLENTSGDHVCPECGRKESSQRRLAFEEAEPRRWRDRSLGDYVTYVEITPWRIWCCGGTRVEAFPWAAPGHRMTRRFFELIGALCTRLPVRQVAVAAGLAWGTVAQVDKEVTRLALGGDRPSLDGLRWIGVDEVSRTGGHVYFTIVTDLETGRVVYVGDGKGEDAMATFFEELGPRGCRRIRGVVSDLSSSYLAAIRRFLPKVTHVLDRFHIVKWANEALNEVRRRIFGAAPDDELGQTLKIKKWLLLTAWENLKQSDKRLLGRLTKGNEPIYIGHLLKEQLRGILSYPWKYLDRFRANFAAWCEACRQSGLPEFQKLARRLENRIDLIEAGFRAPVKLGLVEAINGIIAGLRRQLKGLRDPEYFKFKIYQRCSIPDNPYALVHL